MKEEHRFEINIAMSQSNDETGQSEGHKLENKCYIWMNCGSTLT